MAIANRMSGADLVVQFIHSGGTATLSGDQRVLSVEREQETADATAGSDGARVSIATVKKFSASLETHFIGTAGSAVWSAVLLGTTGTLIYGPQGTATGKPKGSIPMIVKTQTVEFPFDDVAKLTVEFEGQGAEISNPLKDVF